jgi:hypothetical protein
MSDGRQRVVMTGIGVVCPLGIGREEMWRSVMAGRSGAGPITLFDTTGYDVQIACEAHGFVPTDFIDRKASRRMDRYAQLAVAAARLAVADADFTVDEDGAGIGAIIGNGGSGTISREEQHVVMLERGPDRVSPFAIPLSVANMGAGQVSIELGLRGPVTAMCTACAAGTDAIGTAAEVIRRGDARTATMTRRRRRGPSTRTGTASWWARPAPWWCWSAWRMPWPAAPGSSVRWPGTARAPTATTSPTPIRAARHRRARCGRRSTTPACRPPRSTTSTPTGAPVSRETRPRCG